MSNRIFFFIQSILKYFPFYLGIILRRALYRPFFKGFGVNVTIHDNVMIKYPSDIIFLNNITINTGTHIVGKSGLQIGNNCMIGAGSKIVTSSHMFDRIDIPMIDQGLSFESIEIEDDVWVGFDVKVLAGALIGIGSICGTNTVVRKGIYPAYSVIAGIPGVIIKNRTELE